MGRGSEQSPGGPGHHDRNAGASSPSELRRRVDELEAESSRHRVLVAESQDTAQMALEARDEARARAADLTQLLAQAGQQQCELRRRAHELESERNLFVYRVATAEDNSIRACAARDEARASEAGLKQRLAQMEAVAALGAEPGGREELRQAERTESPPPPPPPPLALGSPFSMSSKMVTIQADCSWHTATSWSGVEWPTTQHGFITDGNVVTNSITLEANLQSLRDRLFWNGQQGWEFFQSVVNQRFSAGHLHVKFMATAGKYVGIELACARCWKRTCIQVNTKWAAPEMKDEARATLLSYISGCEYYVPGSGTLRQS